jgi:hypothetical protein
MGDDKYYTIQIKGTAYRFAPLQEDDVTRVVTVINMSASPVKSLKVIMKVLAGSAGAEQWDEITDRLISGEVSVEDISGKLFKKLVERQKADQPAPADAE